MKATAKNAKVHIGFYNAFLEAQFEVFDEVQRLHKEHPNFKVLYTGHSLGAGKFTNKNGIFHFAF